LADGRVLVAGDQGVRGSADLYDPRTRSFTATADMSFPRDGFTLTLLADGTVLAPGGFNDFNQIALSSVELYHPDTGTWTLTGHLGQKRDQYASALLHDGTVLVAGGTPKKAMGTAELYHRAWAGGPVRRTCRCPPTGPPPPCS